MYFSIFKLVKTIKKEKKGLIYRAGPTRMRRGMQGHMAKPRGTHANAYVARRSHEYVYYIFIYIYIYIYIILYIYIYIYILLL